MKQTIKPALLLTTVALSLSLTACSGSDQSKDEQRTPIVSTAVAVDPLASTDAVADAGVKSVDSTFTAPITTEVSSQEDYTRVARDAKNPIHTFSVSALAAGSANAERYASYEAFLSARAGKFEQVKADGYSWAYVGQEADGAKSTPLAGLVARNADGSVFLCAWSGDYAPSADEAVKVARARLDSMKTACEVRTS